MCFVECERVKEEYRKNKQKIDEMNECIVLGETRKKGKIKFDDHKVEKISDHRYKDIKKCIDQFHSSIAVGPLLYVHAVIKHGLEKVYAF